MLSKPLVSKIAIVAASALAVGIPSTAIAWGAHAMSPRGTGGAGQAAGAERLSAAAAPKGRLDIFSGCDMAPDDTDDTTTDLLRAASPRRPEALGQDADAARGSVDLAWLKPDNGGARIICYVVQYQAEGDRDSRAGVGGLNKTKAIDVDPATCSADQCGVVTDLPVGVNYKFRVAAVTHSRGYWSRWSDFTMPTGKPSAPPTISLTAVAGNGTSVKVSWGESANTGGHELKGYSVERRAGSGAWSVVKDLTTVRSFTSTDLTPGTTYQFRVATLNKVTSKKSYKSGYKTSTETFTAYAAPGTPRITYADVDQGTDITLTWRAPADNGRPITDYTIEVLKRGEPNYSSAKGDTRSTHTEFLVTGTDKESRLKSGEEYMVRVCAVNAAGCGPWAKSDWIEIPSVPSEPRNLKADGGNGQVELSWDPPNKAGKAGAKITGYEVEMSTDGGDTWKVLDENTKSTKTDFTVKRLTNGQAYTFQVAAHNKEGLSLASKTASATPLGPPSSPRNVVATAGASSITVAWDAPRDDGGNRSISYQLETSTDGRRWSNEGKATPAETATVHNVKPGTKLYVRVTAIAKGGESDPSATASATVPLPVLPAEQVYALGAKGAVTVYWSLARGSAQPRNWLVEWRVAGGAWKSATLSPSASSQKVNAARNQLVEFKVTGVKADGTKTATVAASAKAK